MPSKSFQTRLVRAEQVARKKGKAGFDCLCFPDNEQPFFGFPIEEKIADEVKCPLHGDRFMHFFRLYVPPWRRESERKRWAQRSEQFRKAWLVTFPAELWPAAEQVVDGKQMLRLKDGTSVLTVIHKPELRKVISIGADAELLWLRHAVLQTADSMY